MAKQDENLPQDNIEGKSTFACLQFQCHAPTCAIFNCCRGSHGTDLLHAKVSGIPTRMAAVGCIL